MKILAEATVIGSDGFQWRPDRVVIFPDGKVEIIDYKFGEEDPRYLKQVLRYMNLYRKMGHENVRGYIWYVPENTVTECGPDSGISDGLFS